MNDNQGTNEWDGDEGIDEDNIDALEQQKELEEAHQHFLIRDFGALVLELGSTAVISRLDDDARQELSMAFNNLRKGE